ncbi:MAG: tripartite tricarboxylate transporter substrate-binding protein [Burkholderiaceae bacterium]
MIIPFPPGGPTDMVARVLAVQLSEQLGQQVIPENRAGANGNIGGELVAHAPADGYTLLYNTSSIVLSRSLYAKLGYDLFKDLTPVAMVASIPMVLAVNPSIPAKNFAEFVALLKAQPDKYSYGSPGNGNVGHLASALILKATGTQAVHVPYKGSAPALTDTASGQVSFMTDSANSILPFIKDRRLRPLVGCAGNSVTIVA